MSKPNPFLKNSGTSRFALKDENKYKNKYENNYENKTEDNAPVSSRWSNIKSDLDEMSKEIRPYIKKISI